MSATGQATGAALALCEVMGWDTDLGRSDGMIARAQYWTGWCVDNEIMSMTAKSEGRES